ncbi:MAG: M48 family metalloprotease [Vicinamibacterales bacterium]
MTAASLSACATNPATGERQLSLISPEQEVAMGREAAAQVQQTLGFVDMPELQSYVSRIGQTLARTSERPDLPWEFHVVDDPVPNAFALPGGFIYVTRGMMNLMTTEAQLASVLGHEIGHVTARHSVNQISKQQLAQLGFGLGAVFVPQVRPFESLLGTGLGLLFLKYGRDDEREADTLGFGYILRHDYDVRQFDDVFEVLERAGGEEGAIPNWLSTHPAPGERAEAAEARASGITQDADVRVGREDYLRRIDTLVYGNDPRDGFFRDGVFYHPRLRFQIEFPGEWQSANLTQAVVAAAPQNRALLQLTLAGDAKPDRALARFYEQAGVQAGRAVRATVGGEPAAMGEFQANTQSGVVQGLVSFVTAGGRTYQIVGYTSAELYGSFAKIFERSIRSFGPVTRSDILSVQPDRIDIVQLSRPMTVEEFAKEYDSSVPADELALLNHQPSADSRIPAGTLLKRVIG